MVGDGYIYELYEPADEIPKSVLVEAKEMYFDAYLHPKLHEGVSLEALNLAVSYEEFIADLFERDFASYQKASARYYFQGREVGSGQIVGICAVLENGPFDLYIDHIGVAKEYRRKGIGGQLLQSVIAQFPMSRLSLDTRIFNGPAQALYQKLGFIKMPHPNPEKVNQYYFYVLTPS